MTQSEKSAKEELANGTADVPDAATNSGTEIVLPIDEKQVKTQQGHEKSIKETISDELERIGLGGKWVWTLFILCVTPNILNGFHVSSYVFLGHLPSDSWCEVPALQNNNWTVEQRMLISRGANNSKCTVYDWDYSHFKDMSFEDAQKEVNSEGKPSKEIECNKFDGYSYHYEDGASTIVKDWNLVCDRAVHRTSAQLSLSIGKFLGSFSFGFLADKGGRKTSFTVGAFFFLISSLICTFSPWYTLFLFGRLGLGAASSGLFYGAFTLLTENISVKHRSWMSIAFAASYPVGLLILSALAYLIEPWRYLQLALTIPAFFLVINVYLLKESPRWLLSKERYTEAYEIVFNKKCDVENETILQKSKEKRAKEIEANKNDNQPTFKDKFRAVAQTFYSLYGQPHVRRMVLTCYFMWCVTSLSYYVTALNAQNMDVNRYLFVAITGCVDIPSYILPIVLLRFMGRKYTTLSLYVLAGVPLLALLLVSSSNVTATVFLAMMGRFGISSAYSIVTLYTAELFPTEIRNSALGTCSTFSHVGSMSAPYVVDILGQIDSFLPTTICGSGVLVAGLLTITLPETSTGKLADTVEEVEHSEEEKNPQN